MTNPADEAPVLDISFSELMCLNDLAVSRTTLWAATSVLDQMALEDEELAVLAKMPQSYQSKVKAELLGRAEALRESLRNLDGQLLKVTR